MFAPHPIDYNSELILIADLKSNHKVNIFNNDLENTSPITPIKSTQLTYTKWMSYFSKIEILKNSNINQSMINWFCKKWNKQNMEKYQANKITVIFNYKKTPAPGLTNSTAEANSLGTYDCE